MPRNRIFISYSHRDEALFKGLLVHLKPWQDRNILDIWTDLDIKASGKWHEKIQEAVGSTAVAVLLISPDFMASDYIRDHELPPFLKAAEERQPALACLYLKPSQVADDDYAFTVMLDSGESEAVKLSDYQGLNKPEEILAGTQEQRDALFGSAARQIKDLYKQYVQEGRPRLPPSGQRHELTIQLELSGNHLFRTFYSQHTRLTTGYSLRPPPSNPGTALYETLFGAGQDDKTEDVLQPLFPHAVKPTPVFSPVRVRIQAREPSLAELPWTQTTWSGKRLWDYGWTFELLGEATVDEIAAFPTLHLQALCPVLLIAPGKADDGESHLLAGEHAGAFAHPRVYRRCADLEPRRPR
ncbi:MAG: toll/interleukin-1 receptor domain-containing protein [Candidatus Competibacteraceae bacterium]